MRFLRYWLALAVALSSHSSLAADLRIGRAAISISPPIGAPIGSSYGITPSTGIHDDLFAKAIVMEVGGTRAAIVACDLVSLRKEIVAETRRLVASTTRVPPENVILSATHCHAGPQMHPLFLAHVPTESRQLGERYVAALPGRIASAVQQAEADLQPARAWTATVKETAISFNRRFLMRDGSVQMNPRRGNPDIVRPTGPIDPDVNVVYFDSPDGKPLATHVNFALHVAIIGGSQVSADYPGVLAKALAQVKGSAMLTLFTNGMSGNINHLDVGYGGQPSGLAEAARVGTILAADVLKAYRSLRPLEVSRLIARTRPVSLPVASFTVDEVSAARNTLARYGRPGAPPFNDVVRAWKIVDIANLQGKPLDTEVQAIVLGDQLAWVGMPGDAFVELGLSIKHNSPFEKTIVSEQSGSGAISYVPNRKAFPQGAYEVISARFLPGGGEMLADAAIALLIEAYRDLNPR